jgi:glutamyl-tRNA reductase
MNMRVVGCSHRNAPIAIRERLAFSSEQARSALAEFRRQFEGVEAVILSTCNRIELYTAGDDASAPTREQLAQFLARFHGLEIDAVLPLLYEHAAVDAVRHLLTVSASLDSMVVGEPQILSQVRQAYQAAVDQQATGPLLHRVFQAALKAARRVASETTIQQRRVSIPSIAVADFARQIFERFDDKNVLVIGAGEMAEETLRYLRDEGARAVTIVNRSFERAGELAGRWNGRAVAWDELTGALIDADLVVSTTGAEEPIVGLDRFLAIQAARGQRPLFVLDLAVPRDFDPSIGDRAEVYLYSIDDLRQACQRNLAARDKELPAAQAIIEEETERFVTDWHHRVTGPVLQQLKQGWERSKEDELRRLLNKLSHLDDRSRDEIRQSFDRLLNKLLHPPMESLRDESRHGIPRALLDALARLFQLKD